MTPEQEKSATFWKYLTKGISYNHQQAWYQQILKEEGFDEAELFLKRVKYSNRIEL